MVNRSKDLSKSGCWMIGMRKAPVFQEIVRNERGGTWELVLFPAEGYAGTYWTGRGRIARGTVGKMLALGPALLAFRAARLPFDNSLLRDVVRGCTITLRWNEY
jgi:hypothetical protein